MPIAAQREYKKQMTRIEPCSAKAFELKKGQFLTVVDTEGKVYKQIYGIDFKPKTVLESIDMAIEQKKLWVRFINIMDAIKAFCYTYDAKTGRYAPNFAILMPVILGGLAQIFIIALLIYIFRRAVPKK